MKNVKIKKHINELCLQSGMQSKEFEEKISDAINSDEKATVNIPDHSTMNRWYNGETEPNPEMFPYIAKALDVSEEEILLGEKPETDYLKEEIKRVSEILELNEKERQKLSRLLFKSKYYLRLFATILFAFSAYLLNITLWKNVYIFLIAIIVILITIKYDKRKYKDYYAEEKRKSFSEKNKENIEFIKFLLKKELVSRLCLNMFIMIVAIIFLPVLETLFYRGKFYITCTMYFLIGSLLFYRSMSK